MSATIKTHNPFKPDFEDYTNRSSSNINTQEYKSPEMSINNENSMSIELDYEMINLIDKYQDFFLEKQDEFKSIATHYSSYGQYDTSEVEFIHLFAEICFSSIQRSP